MGIYNRDGFSTIKILKNVSNNNNNNNNNNKCTKTLFPCLIKTNKNQNPRMKIIKMFNFVSKGGRFCYKDVLGSVICYACLVLE